MQLTKWHIGLFAGLIGICLLVVFWSLRDASKETDIESQAVDAEKDRDKQEKAQRKQLEKELGVAIPTQEEVERLVSVTTNQMLYEEIVLKEYGKKYGKYIFDAYVREELPSNKDNERVAQLKKSLILQEFDETAYPASVDLLYSEFDTISPFSSISTGFNRIADGLLAGYLSTAIFMDETKQTKIPTVLFSYVLYPEKTFTAQELEDALRNVSVSIADNEGTPTNRYYREMNQRTGTTSEYTEASHAKIDYLGVHPIFNAHKPKDIHIYEGTPLTISYIVELHNVNVREVTSLDVVIGEGNFQLQRIDNPVRLPYKFE